MSLLLACLGLGILVWRLMPRRFGERHGNSDLPLPPAEAGLPTVSIIIPARNEASNLPRLLRSLQDLSYPDVEVIVVDDHSTDGTGTIARELGVRVIDAPERPEDWAGKPWACWQGAQAARGEYLLFTDADTMHLADSLDRVIPFMQREGLDLCSTPPFHRTETLWEKLLGPFHLFLLLASAPYQPPQPRRLFAIGQYLLFRRECYWKLGGHEAVRETLAEDLAFAAAALEQGRSYAVYMDRPLYHVRMYDSFPAFVAGWRRIIRWGMERGNVWSTVEVTLAMFAILGAGRMLGEWPYLAVALTSLTFLAVVQQRWGSFSLLGVVCFPFSVLMFSVVTGLSLVDRLLRRPSLWRGRAYRAGVN